MFLTHIQIPYHRASYNWKKCSASYIIFTIWPDLIALLVSRCCLVLIPLRIIRAAGSGMVPRDGESRARKAISSEVVRNTETSQVFLVVQIWQMVLAKEFFEKMLNEKANVFVWALQMCSRSLAHAALTPTCQRTKDWVCYRRWPASYVACKADAFKTVALGTPRYRDHLSNWCHVLIRCP